MTSVKEFRVEEEPTASTLGRGSFVFTDAYSVFDWGQMPNDLPDKGRSLCTMGAFNFELLKAEAIPTHYRGVREEVGDSAVEAELDACERAPREMAIDLTQVPELPREGRDYDYSAYHRDAGQNYLIPLEIVFRNRVPVGSSLRRRTPPAAHGLPFDEWPDEPVELDEPIVEFSTKYEESDRYLDRAEADKIAGPAVSLEALESVARAVNAVITDQATRTGLVHQDGKIECLAIDGEVRVADVVGTLDENRFAAEGQQISKEVIRQYYKRADPEWVAAVEEAKTAAKRRDIADWRSLCGTDPDPLPADVVALGADMYRSAANAYTERGWFDAPALETVVKRIRRL